jgi:Domain of unknown function (DUF397)
MRHTTAPRGRWFTSSRSTSNAACVEVRFEATTRPWFKSARSSDNAQCVEVRFAEAVGVRDSKDRGGPALAFGENAWGSFVSGLKAGSYDLD